MSTKRRTDVQKSPVLPHGGPESDARCERCGKGTVVWDAEMEKSACDRCGKVYAPPSV